MNQKKTKKLQNVLHNTNVLYNTYDDHNNKTNNTNNSKTGKRVNTFPELNKELSAYIIYILKKYSSYDNPLSSKEIYDYIQKELGELFKNETVEYNTTAVTIRTNLDNLYELSDPYSGSSPYKDLFIQLYGGILIQFYKDPESTRTHPRYIEANEYTDIYEDTDESEIDGNGTSSNGLSGKKSNKKKYYYFKSIFTEEDFLIMESSIETNPYMSANDSRKLMDKLYNTISNDIVLNSYKNLKSFNQHIPDNSANLLNNISILIKHIRDNHQIEINYGKYAFNRTTKKPELVSKKNKANWQRIDPIAIIQANGFYYLVAHTDKSKDETDVISYRVDRIIDIDVHRDLLTNKPLTIDKKIIEYRSSFSAIDYLKSHPVMYAGDKTDIRMLVMESKDFPVINSLIDTFGTDINIYSLKESETLKYFNKTIAELEDKGEHWYMVHLNHSSNGTVLWAKQHIEHARIISPKETVDALINAVTSGLKLYEM